MYNFNEILLFFNEKQKLEKIIYYKELQKSFCIDNYKKISGKYKVAGRNWKGNEYKLNTDILIFEGKYLNKKRNEMGKEYYDKMDCIMKENI